MEKKKYSIRMPANLLLLTIHSYANIGNVKTANNLKCTETSTFIITRLLYFILQLDIIIV